MSTAASSMHRDALTDRVYEAIRERIVEQAYAPSQRLRTQELAANLGVSATPVREALNRLASERLVISTPHRGFAIAPELEPHGYADLFDACILLQVQAGRLGADRATSEDLEIMVRAIEGADEASRQGGYEAFRAFVAFDRAFHTHIMVLSANQFLVELWEALQPYAHLARLYHRALLTNTIAGTYSTAEHWAILDTYHRRDPTLVGRMLQQHMRSSKARWVAFAEQTTAVGDRRFAGRSSGRSDHE